MTSTRAKKSALAIIAGVLAAGLMPPIVQPKSAWAGEHLIVADGPRAGERFDLALTPYLREPLDACALESPDNEVVVMKSAQTGFTTMFIGAIGHQIDQAPTSMMLVQPNDGALKDFVNEKLRPSLEKTAPTRAKVRPQNSRSDGSNTYSIKYPGGTLALAIATSKADLSSKTRQIVYLDEVDRYPSDLEGEGHPIDLAAARQESFLASGEWKRVYVSTPTIEGSSAIARLFEESDQRRWHVQCDDCAEWFVFDFECSTFGYDVTYPYRAWHDCPHCGAGRVEYWQRDAKVRAGRWIATKPGPGRRRGYHFDAMSSPFVPWSATVKQFVEAGESLTAHKAFRNLKLGRPVKLRGDAPDHQRLLERRRPAPQGVIPAECLMLTAGVDVQHYGLYVEIVAWDRDQRSTPVLAVMIPGDTDDIRRGAWLELTRLYDTRWAWARGGAFLIDLMGVDAGDGGRASQVYLWCARHARARATKGVGGWSHPAIASTPTRVEIKGSGKRAKRGAMLWTIGVDGLKAVHYDRLRKEGRAAGAEVDPPGYCHMPDHVDEKYVKGITSESLKTVTDKHGRARQIWAPHGQNHFLDARVIAMAMADLYGINRATADTWAQREANWVAEAGAVQNDLFTASIAAKPQPVEPPSAPAATEAAPPAAPAPSPAIASLAQLYSRR